MSLPTGHSIAVCGNIFRLVEVIGRGSYGTVHKATNLSSGAAVAIKLIAKDKVQRPHERQSIDKEIETMRVAVEQYENGHPHIVRLLCTKESQHHIFIVLEYCAGGDISDMIKSQRGLPEAQAKTYMAQLASGLQFLRSQNVVHRDLKPANLLLSSKNYASAKLKIADFGFARELEKEKMAESVVGSPLYMAPELLEYKSYDAKADLWSVGIILYEMLVNDHPFLVVDGCHATNHLALRRNIYSYFRRHKKVVIPSNVFASSECADLIAALLRVDPQDRISFEDFFNASFLLPPLPSEYAVENEDVNSLAGGVKHAFIAEPSMQCADDWGTFSDEYVIVEKEYEDVGRKVLDAKDLNVDIDDQTPIVSIEKAEIEYQGSDLTMLDDSSFQEKSAFKSPTAQSPKNDTMTTDGTFASAKSDAANPRNAIILNQQLAEALLLEGKRGELVYEEDQIEISLGISFRAFSCGSVALFVPTPLGDYIAFHEGCPHYYLAEESIQAFKRNDRNPPYVLGGIVYIENHITSQESNPYRLREGMKYHVVTVAPLASAKKKIGQEGEGLEEPLPLSQKLAGLSTQDLTSRAATNSSSPLASPSSHAPTSNGPHNHHLQQHQRISFRNFQINHIALFFLKGGKLPYVAFNEGMPNYYLSSESIQASRMNDDDESQQLQAYICGEIIFIDTFQATEDFNPYRLAYGTRFHIVTVFNPKRT